MENCVNAQRHLVKGGLNTGDGRIRVGLRGVKLCVNAQRHLVTHAENTGHGGVKEHSEG